MALRAILNEKKDSPFSGIIKRVTKQKGAIKLNITREDMPGRQVALTIELEPETINTALDRAYRQMVNQVDIPGFRRGKAPRYIVERYVGMEMLTERAVKHILPQTLRDSIAD